MGKVRGMLSIFFYDKEQEKATQLDKKCTHYLEKTGKTYKEKKCYSDYTNMCAMISSFTQTALYMLKNDVCLMMLSEHIKSINDMSYVVVVVESMEDIFSLNMPAVRPSGLLLENSAESNLEKVIDEIYSDYERSCDETDGLTYCFKSRGIEYKVPFCRIMLIEISCKKVLFHTESQQYEFYDTLETVMKSLPDYFIRIHRSMVVNTNFIKIVNYREKTIFMNDGSTVFFSRNYSSEIKNYMGSTLKENIF